MMNKQEFLTQLRKGLSGLPQDDIEERLTFYSEMIEDRMEEGLSENDAVSEIGPIDTIIAQIVTDIPLTKLVKEKITPKRRLKAWEIVLLALGSPIWLSLLLAAFAVALSLYIVLWSALLSLWAIFVSLVGCALGGIAGGTRLAIGGNGLISMAVIGAGIVCAGLSIFLFYGCKAATKDALSLTKKTVLGTKNRFIKKEEA